MDPSIFLSGIGAFERIMLRAAGSKRQFSFLAWLMFVGLVRPASETLWASVLVLLFLWLLFVRFPSGDGPIAPPAPEVKQ